MTPEVATRRSVDVLTTNADKLEQSLVRLESQQESADKENQKKELEQEIFAIRQEINTLADDMMHASALEQQQYREAVQKIQDAEDRYRLMLEVQNNPT